MNIKSKNNNQRNIYKKKQKLGGKLHRIYSKTNKSKKKKINKIFVNKIRQFGGKLEIPNDICIIPNEKTNYEIEERNNINKSILEGIINMWERNKHEWIQDIEWIEETLEEALYEDLNGWGVWPDDEMSNECKKKWDIQYSKLFYYLLSDVLSFKDMNKNNNGKISNNTIFTYQLEKGMNNFELSELMKIINKKNNINLKDWIKYLKKYQSKKYQSNKKEYFENASKERFASSLLQEDKSFFACKNLNQKLESGSKDINDIILYIISRGYPKERYNAKSGIQVIIGLKLLIRFYDNNPKRKDELVFYLDRLIELMNYNDAKIQRYSIGSWIPIPNWKTPPAFYALILIKKIPEHLNIGKIQILFDFIDNSDNLNIFILDLMDQILEYSFMYEFRFRSNRNINELFDFILYKMLLNKNEYIRYICLKYLLKYLNQILYLDRKKKAIYKIVNSCYNEIMVKDTLINILCDNYNVEITIPRHNPHGIREKDDESVVYSIAKTSYELLYEMIIIDPDLLEDKTIDLLELKFKEIGPQKGLYIGILLIKRMNLKHPSNNESPAFISGN